MKTFLTAVLVGAFLSLGVPGQAAVTTTLPTFFGMHDNTIWNGDYPSVQVGAIRLWDTNTSWRHLQPSRGEFDWTLLDRSVELARSHGAAVDLVMGVTPRWAAKYPDQMGSVFGPGAGSEVADLEDWRTYVRAVVTRYQGRVSSYEPWNEADLGMFYQGSQQHLASLARILFEEVNRIDPSAIVTSPSVVARSSRCRAWLASYMKLGGRYTDVVSMHGYPEPNGTPESATYLVRDVRARLAAIGVHKPIWDTELNYGLPWGGRGITTALSPRMQSAYVMRSFLLQRDAGVRRLYWYNWSYSEFLGVKMFNTDTSTTLAPAAAFRTVRSWMAGRWMGCSHKADRYTCRVRTTSYDRVIRWNPAKAPMPRMKKVSR